MSIAAIRIERDRSLLQSIHDLENHGRGSRVWRAVAIAETGRGDRYASLADAVAMAAIPSR